MCICSFTFNESVLQLFRLSQALPAGEGYSLIRVLVLLLRLLVPHQFEFTISNNTLGLNYRMLIRSADASLHRIRIYQGKKKKKNKKKRKNFKCFIVTKI